MGLFIDNVNKYLVYKKIKRSYISLKSGIEVNKLSRILNGVQEATVSDMDKIAYALGERIEFFLKNSINVSTNRELDDLNITFHTGKLGSDRQEYAEKMIDFLENIDAVLGVEKKLSSLYKE